MKNIVFISIVLIFAGAVFWLVQPQAPGTKTPVSNIFSPGNSEEAQVQSPISIPYLRSLNIKGSGLTIEEDLGPYSNFHEYIASYRSEGNKIFGLLTVPEGEMPKGGWPAIVFNHGYIPPKQYVTTERYVAYVNYLAESGFVVFKIDLRGNGRSEGDAAGTYFSNAYTIDAISALKALQTFDRVNPKRIGMWGHSMAGNLIFRAMLVSDEIKAGVIWAGAVYSYEDFAKYGISDNSYVHRPYTQREGTQEAGREVSSEIQKIRSRSEPIDFSSPFWRAISLTQNLEYLKAPVQLHHAEDDPTVNINYSRDLAANLKKAGKSYEIHEYEGGGHNIESPYFETAMERTVEFFRKKL